MSTPTTIERNEVQVRPGISPGLPGKEPKRRWWVWLLALAVLGYGGYRVRKGMVAPQATTAAQGANLRLPSVPVVAAKTRKGDIGVYYTGLGAVTPIYTVTVKSQISGYLMQVLYKEGQTVRKGDSLAEIDPRPYQVMLEQAQAGFARDEANLENARVDLKRYQILTPLKAVPEQQLATQEATVKQDEGIVQTDQALIDIAKLDLVYCHITAPITGRVGLRLVDPGNYVTANDSTGLVVITQVEPITVIFTLPEDQLPAILAKMHAGARLKVEAYDREMKTRIAQGWLSTIDNQIDPETGTVKLRANFDNRDGALFPNQFVNARLLVEEKHEVTLVPTAAVQRNAQTTYVFLVKPDSTVTVLPITIGTTEGYDSEVLSGLSPGDVVVMTGVDKLQEGSKVRVQMYGEGTQTGS
ncbi:MAG: efflux RND transporter periplasmic adaptor subunit [Terriglobia bacterium]|jgi:multidrug efflux system membrane fusion protein